MWISLENIAMAITIVQPASIQKITKVNISINRCTFSHNSLTLDKWIKQGHFTVVLVNSMSKFTNLNVSVRESSFISNEIWYSPQFYGLSLHVSIVSIKVQDYLSSANIKFSEVTFKSNRMQFSGPSSILEILIAPKSLAYIYIQLISCNFINNTAFSTAYFQKQRNFNAILNSMEVQDQGSGYEKTQYGMNMSLFGAEIDIMTVIDDCTFSQNVASKGVICINNNYDVAPYSNQFMIHNSTFESNIETVIYAMNQHVTFKEVTNFKNNIAEYGAAIYLDFGSSVNFGDNSEITFISNFARKYGGAIFYEAPKFIRNHDNVYTIPIEVGNNSIVIFSNNAADIAGNSIYFSMSQSFNVNISSLLDAVTGLNFSDTDGHLITSPNELVLYSPAALINDTDTVTQYKLRDIMLGQAINIPVCVLDHQNIPAGKVLFQVTRLDFNQNLSLLAPNFISLSCESGISNIHITGKLPKVGNNSVIIQLYSSYDGQTDWKPIKVILIIELSDCRSGYFYDEELKQCVCYNKNNVVSCFDGNATILKGFWFGMINDKPTVTNCPINYCK